MTTSRAIAKRVSRSTTRNHCQPMKWHESGQPYPQPPGSAQPVVGVPFKSMVRATGTSSSRRGQACARPVVTRLGRYRRGALRQGSGPWPDQAEEARQRRGRHANWSLPTLQASGAVPSRTLQMMLVTDVRGSRLPGHESGEGANLQSADPDQSGSPEGHLASAAL